MVSLYTKTKTQSYGSKSFFRSKHDREIPLIFFFYIVWLCMSELKIFIYIFAIAYDKTNTCMSDSY